MNWKNYLTITILSLALVIFLASFQSAPGYMDAEYYYSMALRIGNKQGFSEPFAWNYLTRIPSLPHPGFTYWMPLPALLSALGIWISGIKSFLAARAAHILAAALIPSMTMKVAYRMTGSQAESMLVGGFSVVPIFYNVFLGTTDSFAITMLLGAGIALLLLEDDQPRKFIFLGAMAGLMHLTRADGLVWILVGVYCALRTERKKLPSLLLVGAGYLLIMGPWFIRNLIVVGRIMPSGISKTFWLTEYNDLFLYSSGNLTFKRWASQGLMGILGNIARAGSANLKSALLIQGQVILAPFILLGVWIKRRELVVVGPGLVWTAIFLLMTIVFPFAGMRGGFFHSGAAFQPLAWVLASSGFFKTIEWGVTRRQWNREKAGTVFGMALVILLAVASGFVFYDRVIGGNCDQTQWDRSNLAAREIDQYLVSLGSPENEPVLINNPPGLFAAAERPSVVIPSDGMEAMLQSARDFGISYLVLEENHPGAFGSIYQDPASDSRLVYLAKIGQALIFEIPAKGEGHE